MNTNVRAPFFLTRALLPYIPESGRIILISSIAARRYTFGMAQTVYGASKAAVEALARGWAVEVCPWFLQISTLPMYIDTKLVWTF